MKLDHLVVELKRITLPGLKLLKNQEKVELQGVPHQGGIQFRSKFGIIYG